MPFDVMDDEQQQDDQQYQNVNGFNLPVPPKAAPVRTASNPTPVEGMHIAGVQPNGGDDAVKQAMMASSTKMPPAPPQDTQLSNLIQQRQDAGTPLNRNDPKYRMGFKGRLLGSLANFASGVAHQGVAVDVGPGATNDRFARDTADRQAQAKNLDVAIGNREKLDEQNRKEFDSATKQAFESQVASARGDTARARQATADAQQQTADVKQQLADEQSRSITFDAKTKRFMKNGKIYVPKTIEEGAALEAGNGISGYYSKMWSQERKNNNSKPDRQPTELETWMDAFRRQYGRDPSADEIALRHHVGGTGTFKDRASVDKYSDQWYRQERAKVDQQKKNWKSLNPDAGDEETQNAMSAIENEYKQRADDFEERKKGYYDQVGGKGGSTQQAPAAQPKTSAKADYKFKTKPNAKGQVLGSNDGKSWFDIKTGKPYGR